MLSDKQVKALLQVPEIVPPKRRNHTRGDIQTPAQIEARRKVKRRNHIQLGFNPYLFNGGTSGGVK